MLANTLRFNRESSACATPMPVGATVAAATTAMATTADRQRNRLGRIRIPLPATDATRGPAPEVGLRRRRRRGRSAPWPRRVVMRLRRMHLRAGRVDPDRADWDNHP